MGSLDALVKEAQQAQRKGRALQAMRVYRRVLGEQADHVEARRWMGVALYQLGQLRLGPGFRIRQNIERVSLELVDRYRVYETADISDMLNRLYSMTSQIRNLVNDLPLCGPAITVKCYPGDNLMVHKSLDLAQPATSSSWMPAVIGRTRFSAT